MPKKRYIVTGGLGFIGSGLIHNLLACGDDISILNVDSNTYAANKNNCRVFEEDTRYSFMEKSINDDDICDVLTAFEPDIIFHLAAESHVDNSLTKPEIFVETNVLGTVNLLKASSAYLAQQSSKKREGFRFLHVSTDEVFGDLDNNDPPFSECDRYEPSSPYSASKASSDHFVRAWQRSYGLPAIVTNCSNNYGPRQAGEKLIPTVLRTALSGQRIPIYGTGRNIRDWLYVDDHCEALVLIAEKGDVGGTYAIGGNTEKTNLDLAHEICDKLDIKIEHKPNGVKKFSDLIEFVTDRLGHDRRYAINCSKLETTLGWVPKTDFGLGLNATIDWYLENPDYLEKKAIQL